ncbi:MAG: acyl-CoA dehydrogenase family protein [Pseudomonadales bacterium]
MTAPASTFTYSFTEEQEQFRDAVRRFLVRHSPTAEVRRLMDTETGFDPEVWMRMCSDLGLSAIAIPEAHGGAGFSLVELGIVMEESGRTLLCAPYFSSAVLATRAILHAGSAADRDRLLPGLAAGTRRGTLACSETDRGPAPGSLQMRAEGADHRLNGTKTFVVDGLSADFFVVVARRGDALGLYTVDADAPGVSRHLLTTMDSTRKLAEVHFDNVPALPLGDAGSDSTPALSATLDDAAIALAHEMVGGAQVLLESAVAYAGRRVQFGRTIGSFQAIKHKCADMLLDVESARSAAYYAAEASAAGDPETPALACLAKAAAADAYVRAAIDTIQIHGGLGFTWENDTHLWFKRAKSSEVLLGTPDYHRELMLQRWGH